MIKDAIAKISVTADVPLFQRLVMIEIPKNFGVRTSPAGEFRSLKQTSFIIHYPDEEAKSRDDEAVSDR
jgi:hypothetical protein